MNKSLLALTIAASLALTGCGDNAEVKNKVQYEPYITDSLKADTKIVFDVLTDPILPTFLAMDTTDGTLATEGNVGEDGYSTDLADPLTALGKTDGWSVTQAIVLPFDKSIDLNTDTAASFHILKSDSPLDANFSPENATELIENTHYVVKVTDNSLIIQPIIPFEPKTNYMFALTNSLTDANGETVGMSNSYAMLKSAIQAPNESLIGAQAITKAIEGTVALKKQIDPTTIIYSSWFTTTSVGDVLFATKGAIASAMSAISAGKTANEVWNGSANPNNVDTTGLFGFSDNADISAAIAEPYQSLLDAKGLTTYKGTVSLPYFLETSVSGDKWKKTPWQSGMPSLAKISNALNNGSDADKSAIMTQLAALGITTEDLANVASDLPTQLKVMTALTGKTLALADGSQLDKERLISRYSPVPQLKSVENVPYLLIMPNPADCAGVTTGVPVNLFQHGITSGKENVLALAPAAIGGQCQALIAIDHPLHGERALSDGTVTDENHPDVYMNLSYLTVGRDNFRQSIADSMGLRAALGAIFVRNSAGDPTVAAPFNLLSPVNGSRVGVGYIGHSLGAMTGIGYTATVSNKIADDDTENAVFAVSRAQFASPGAGIPYLLMNSPRFGGVVKSSLLSVASKDYLSFKSQFCPQGTDPASCYDNFYGNLSDVQKATVDDTLTSFAYVAQTVLDTVDPINHIGGVTTPSYLTMVVGDEVIPNGLDVTEDLPYTPFGGTAPLIFSGYEQITSTTDNALREAVTFVTGSHSSLLDPGASEPITAEMQTQTASFIGKGGITVTTSSLLTTIPTP